MFPPIVEIYVVWHPGDRVGSTIADEFVQHFHGTRFAALMGGAAEVYPRSQGDRREGAPQPIPFPGAPPANRLAVAQFVAVVPVLGEEFADVVKTGEGAGRTTLRKSQLAGLRLRTVSASSRSWPTSMPSTGRSLAASSDVSSRSVGYRLSRPSRRGAVT